MVSGVFLFICAFVLFFFEGNRAAAGPWKAWTQMEMSLLRGWDGSPPSRGAVREGGATETRMARRYLAARLTAPSNLPSAKATSPVKGAVHLKDAAALQKAAAQWKGKSTVDDRKLLATWDVKRPCSQWFGVTCDSANHRVTAIKLPALENSARPFFMLSGPLPAELGSLPELRTLILARNPLGGVGSHFPKEWARLGKLSHLDLSGNKLHIGALEPKAPQELGNLTSLTYLNLAGTYIGYPTKNFKKLKRLVWLDLSMIWLSNNDVKILENFTKLRFLSLSSTGLGLPGVTRLSKLRGLEHLALSDNPLGAFPTFLKGLTRLVDLRLGSISASAGTLPVPTWLGSLQQLTSLDLSYNFLQGSVPAQLGALPRLARLDLSRNHLAGRVPTVLLNSPSLTHLDLSDNRLKLTAISFGPHAASKLRGLKLSWNSLSGTLPRGLSSLRKLQSLSLSNNELTGTMPPFLLGIPTLTLLDLSYNRITGSIPAGLGALSGLMALDLRSNQLTGSLPSSLFRSGRELLLGRNLLSGNLPASALTLVAQRLQAAVERGGVTRRLPGVLGISENYLTGPCYSSLVASLKCPSDTTECSLIVGAELDDLKGNCLQDCKKVPFGRAPQQRNSTECSRFCGADKRNGPCNGHGSCSLKGPKKVPTCTCSKGFVSPAAKPGTCVPAPKKGNHLVSP